MSIKENAIDGEGKGGPGSYSWRKSPMSSISQAKGRQKESEEEKGENGENKRFIVRNFVVCREAAAGKELRTRTGGARKMQRKKPGAASSNSGNKQEQEEEKVERGGSEERNGEERI